MTPYGFDQKDMLFIDGGRSNWKIITGDKVQYLLPNAIGLGDLDMEVVTSKAFRDSDSADITHFPPILLFEFEGNVYGIGDEVYTYYGGDMRNNRVDVPGRMDVKFDDANYMAMFAAVIAFLGRRGTGRIHVDITLPPDPFKNIELRTEIENKLRRPYTVKFLNGPYAERPAFTVVVDSVKIRCEAVSAFYDVLLTDAERPAIRMESTKLMATTDPGDIKKHRPVRVGIIGVGGHTVNLATFLKGVPQGSTLYSINDLGVNTAYEQIRIKLRDMTGKSLTMAETLAAVQYTEYYYAGNTINLDPIKEQVFGVLATQIYDIVTRDYWRDVFDSLEYLVLYGGGAKDLLPAFRQVFGDIKSLTDRSRFLVSPQPLWSDVIGMRKRHLLEMQDLEKRGLINVATN
jgi:hypothetical protein